MHEYVSHHHQDHHCLPGCNVLCYNAMNRILNVDMVIIPLVQIYFNLPWSIMVEGQRLRSSHAVAVLHWSDSIISNHEQELNLHTLDNKWQK